ncbi:hypothetical protein [Mucilaginibacter sp.]|uniref:hypothetical protein n=1 Tax=Mucilaginibacter sp. TaxID=1882438 RepID=UPI003D12C3F2
MLKLFPLLALLIFSVNVKAQKPDSVVIKKSTVKTLTDEQYTALFNGEDTYGMAKAAELNHYPLPQKALKYKKELDLSPIQVAKLTALEKEFERKKLEMGQTIIHNERTLDSIFKYNRVDNGSLIFYTNRYGLYQGELRNTILQACFATKYLLTPQQVKKIWALEKVINKIPFHLFNLAAPNCV